MRVYTAIRYIGLFSAFTENMIKNEYYKVCKSIFSHFQKQRNIYVRNLIVKLLCCCGNDRDMSINIHGMLLTGQQNTVGKSRCEIMTLNSDST